MKPPKLFEIPAGTPESKCSGCDAQIFWVRSSTGKNMPLVFDSKGLGDTRFGYSHFIDCPSAARFRRPR